MTEPARSQVVNNQPAPLMRHEDERLITGTGKFTGDWNLEGQLHMSVARSNRAHAQLVAVNTSTAEDHPGVVAVYTAADVTAMGYSPIPSGPDLTGVNGEAIVKNAMPLLAIDCVRFVGQAIAVVVAISDAIAQDAAELIEVEYRELAPIASVDSAMAANAELLLSLIHI